MKKLSVRTLLLAVSILLAFVLGACNGGEANTGAASPGGEGSQAAPAGDAPAGGQEKNQLAFFFPLTGEQMQYGTMLRAGAELAVAQWNEAHGTSYVAEFYDDKGDAKEAVNVANKIVADAGVIAGLGSYASTCAMAAAPVFEEKGLMLVSPSASHADFPHMGEYMFSCVMSQKYEGAEYAKEVWNTTGLKTVAIIYQNTDHGIQASELFKNQWEALGGEVVAYETYVPGQSNDFTPILAGIKGLEPDIIYASSAYNDAANIFNQARQLNIDSMLLGAAMCITEDFLPLAGDLDNIMLLSTIPSYMDSVIENSELSEASRLFVDSFREANGRSPDGFAAQAYDTVNILLGCVERVGTDSGALQAELAGLRDFEGVSGFNMTFNDNKEMVKGVYVYTLRDGNFVPYE